ncbi:MAG: hypothetical protein AAGA35_02020 [Patescibacteria group bacterium]
MSQRFKAIISVGCWVARSLCLTVTHAREVEFEDGEKEIVWIYWYELYAGMSGGRFVYADRMDVERYYMFTITPGEFRNWPEINLDGGYVPPPEREITSSRELGFWEKVRHCWRAAFCFYISCYYAQAT